MADQVTLPVLQTLLVEERPSSVSPEFDDAEPLTPAHLLHGHRIMSLPHEEVGEEDQPLVTLLILINKSDCKHSFLASSISDGNMSI